eukprot:TRINITY_DN38393_c0_g1_i1.p1 TRINITY_DN38393_c0_g1~~TRINITY_DN38393_c0_g1_i1.p1  ORF type:complete len:161 (+),score=37.88 TRINITY_DN38393_c0_g1_i1:47-484(+)
MCAKDKFKLCTCDSSSLKMSEVGWELQEEAGSSLARGIAAMIEYKEALTDTLDWITSQLNSGDEVFDITIDPSTHYLLKIRLDPQAGDTFPHKNHIKGDWVYFEWKPTFGKDPSWKLLSGYDPGLRSIAFDWKFKSAGKVKPQKE